VAIVLVLLAILYAALRGPHAPGLPTDGIVLRAVDGDTLEVAANGKTWRVRLIGIDCPESHPSDKLDRDARRTKQDRETIMALGRRASAFTRDLCEGQSCRLEYDKANDSQRHRDKYDRLLAYVYVGDVMVNAEVLRQGYGQAMTRYEFDPVRQEEFRRLERAARDGGTGLWGEGLR
jgi:micrococcal nuclease